MKKMKDWKINEEKN